MPDIIAAARGLRRSRAFTLTATVTLAVAIAANIAMFSVYDRLVVHPVTLADADSLVAIWFNNPQRHIQTPSCSVPRYQQLVSYVHAFSSIGISTFDSFTLTGRGEPAQLTGLRVSASFLPTLGVMPALGRNFTDAEDVPNGPAVCILSDELWRTRFGGDPGIIGQSVTLDGASWQVIGVMPPHLSVPFRQVQVIAPRIADVSGLTPVQIQAGATFAQPIARLRPGVTLEQARLELAAFSEDYKARFPAMLDASNVSEPRLFVPSLVAGIQPAVYTLLAAVGCVLLIACANVSSLLLARLLERRKEIAVRLSLGATRARIVRLCLSESLLFTAAAGIAGVALSYWSLGALQSVVASQVPPDTVLTPNWRTLVFSLVVTLGCGVLTGLLPSLHASAPDLSEHLKDASRGSSAGRGTRLRQVLIVSEVTVSVVLLVGAALLVISFLRLQASAPGFSSRGVASAYVSLPLSRYSTSARQGEFYERVVEELHAEPGVTAAAVSLGLPMAGGTPRTTYGVIGRPLPPLAQRPIVGFNVVTPEYFSLLEIPLVEGRAFTAQDHATATKVCVINQTLARRLFGDRSPLGQALLLGRDAATRIEVVGVMRDVKTAGVNAPTPDEVYVPVRQFARTGMAVAAKTDGEPAALQGAIARAVARVDNTQAIAFFATLDSVVAGSVGSQRLVATLTGLFAALAAGLAMTGLYSVLAYLVTQRTGEIGIRMALGATRRQVVTMIMTSGLLLVSVGLLLGLGGSMLATRLIRQQLFGVEALNPSVFGGVAAAFAVIAALACLAPSLRASRIDPVVAFRTD